MKKAIKKEAIQFNTRYADLEAKCMLVQKELLKNLSYVRKLSEQAKRLYDYGDDKCYIADEKGIRPIEGIKCIGQKMDMLDWLQGAVAELKDLANCFDIAY